MKWIFSKLAVVLFLMLSQTPFASAAPLFRVTASGAPANFSIKLCLNAKGPLSCQNFTVSALNLTITTTIPNHVYSFAGIQINTPGYTLADVGAACTLMSNGMCQFSVGDTAAKAIAVNSSSVPQYAYVTNTNVIPSTVSNCLINTNTGVLSGCGSSTSVLFSDSNSIALNLASARAYITNFGSSRVTLCTIDSITGGLTGCANTASFANPRFITLNSAMTRAYVAGGAGVSLYSVNSGSGELTFVSNYNIGDANGIALNPAGTLAYVVLSDDTVQRCGIDGASGVLITPCTSTGSEFNGAQRITLNSIGTFAYVTNSGSQDITVCSVDSGSGNLSNCSRTAQGVFGGFANMAVNWSNTKAYVPDTFSPNLVSLCSINANGTLSGCTNSGDTNFDGPKGVALG
jgi:hypothetical protein